MIKYFINYSFEKILKCILLVSVLLALVPGYCLAIGTDSGSGGEIVELENEPVETGDDEVYENADLPVLFFKAINPGYKVGDDQNVGEMIEICRENSDTLFSLAGATVGYTNSSGNDSVLLDFPENSWLAGECILLRLASSPGGELAAMNYTKTLALKAGLYLILDDEIVDEVCWNGKDGCYKAFDSANPTTLVRNIEDGEFEYLASYEPNYVEGSYYEEAASDDSNGCEIEDESICIDDETNVNDGGNGSGGDDLNNEDENVRDDETSHGDNSDDKGDSASGTNPGGFSEGESLCKNIRFSEILTYYVENQGEQFIELFNGGDDVAKLDNCKLKYKDKIYTLVGEVFGGSYYIYKSTELKLTKNPVKENILELIGADGEIVDSLKYYNGQKKGTSLALIRNDDEEEWAITYNSTPGEANLYQRFRSCEAGKTINELTGNCVNEVVEVVKICPEGYYLNEATGRCKKEIVEIEKICKDGYYLNESTGRCKKEVVEEEKICKDGYYLNESTGRCRKIVTETIKTCDEGYFLNLETGRCNKIQEEKEKVCQEGYYLNEETGRCRKIRENDGTDYALEPKVYEEKTSFVALYAVLGVAGVAIVYIIFQFRKEIAKVLKRIFH